MGQLESPQQEHLIQISQAQLMEQPAEDDLEDDIGREFEVVERSAGSFIELPSAVATPEDGVAEIGRAVQVRMLGEWE